MNFNTDNIPFDYVRGFSMDFDMKFGQSSIKNTSKRFLSQMKGMYSDTAAYDKIMSDQGDQLVYEFHELDMPEDYGKLSFGVSIVYPGKVGSEYYMTKGHFHTVLNTSEIYFCFSGHGYMMMESPEGDWNALELLPGKAVYVPQRYAHRSINVDPKEALRTFFVYGAEAGHDYGTIETKGYRNLIVDDGCGTAMVVENPKWK